MTSVASGTAHQGRRRELRRMRMIATGLLFMMTAVFVGTRFAPRAWGWPPYAGSFAEAAMIGACADWFAVTALFRRPFGLPIPHTAIIPRNREKIGLALGGFISGEFLSPRILDAKLRAWGPAGRLSDWLGAPANAHMLGARIAAVLPEIAPSGTALREVIGEVLKRSAAAGPISPLASKLLAQVWADAGVRRLLENGLGAARDYLASHAGIVEAQVTRRTWRWTPVWVDRLLAAKVTDGLIGGLDDMRLPDNPWRVEFDAAIERLIDRLANDPETIARGEALKGDLLADQLLHSRLSGLWADVERRLMANPSAVADIVSTTVSRALLALASWLQSDAAARARLDGWLRAAARRALAPRRATIGAFVAQVVAGWDAREVVDKLELQVGRDLQYIRINGTLVGGLVGLAIYALSHALS